MNNRSMLLRSLLTGFIGGLLFSVISLIASYFKIVDFSPKVYLEMMMFKKKWLLKWYGTAFTIIIYGLLSTIIAYIYYVLLRKIDGLRIGIAFGIGLAILVLLIFPLLSDSAPHLSSMTKRSMTATSCIFILYGTFIGYSISFEYEQMMIQLANK